MSITRRFLGWDRPVLELVAEDLLAEATPPILDLSHLLVVVPTRNAGRRLREMLAQLSAEGGRAICPPQVVPPEFLLSLIDQPEAGSLASAHETLLAWAPVLRSADLDEFPTLFPVPPAAQDFRWALSTAKSLNELRSTLGEAGLSIADVFAKLSGSLEEEERWEELARLEQDFGRALADHGKKDLLAVRRENRQSPKLPQGITGIRLAGCPDPLPLAVEVLESLSHLVPVEVWIHAPGALRDDFDAWGRPIPEVWLRRQVEFPGGELPVRVQPSPDGQAALTAEAVLRCDSPSATITIGVLDDEVTGPLQRLLQQGGRATFNPGGSSMRSEGVLHLLRTLRDLLLEERYETFVELLRCPDFDAYLGKTLLFWNSLSAIECLDRLHRRHLFADLRSARWYLTKADAQGAVEPLGALDEVTRLLTRLRQVPRSTEIPDVLQAILGSRLPTHNSRVDRIYQTVSEVFQTLLDALDGPVGSDLDLSEVEIFDLFLSLLEQETLYEDRPPNSVELLGWLELHWDEAPHLIVTGFNEGYAPESITGDVYLPERLRKRLAEQVYFPTNETRLARDTYLFEAILQSRRHHGRVDLCLGKHRRNGDPLRPSRLLFLCPDEELPNRVNLLFHETPPPQGDLPWTAGFRLQPFPGSPPAYEPTSLGVTAFKTYLSSPFHFYLRHVEGMEPIDAALSEMDSLTFGNFCHEVLRRFGKDDGVRHSADVSVIRDFLLEAVDQLSMQWFGPNPTLPVRIQVQAARARLIQAADIQAQTRAEGWMILETELSLSDPGFTISGVTVKGRIDRIDRHESSGAIRVLDYKTGDRGEMPNSTHVGKVGKKTGATWLPEYACFALGNATLRWKDLQLPLYRLGLASTYGPEIECGYFNLPRAVTETGIHVWPGLSPVHDAAALACAEGIIHDLRAGRFWPAPQATQNDSFVRVHLGLPEKTIAFPNLLPSSAP